MRRTSEAARFELIFADLPPEVLDNPCVRRLMRGARQLGLKYAEDLVEAVKRNYPRLSGDARPKCVRCGGPATWLCSVCRKCIDEET